MNDEVRAYIRLSDNSVAEAVIYDDDFVKKWGKLGAFGAATDPKTEKRVKHIVEWPKDEAPTFQVRVEIVLEELTRKLNVGDFS